MTSTTDPDSEHPDSATATTATATTAPVDPGLVDPGDRRDHIVAGVLLTLFALGFLLAALPRITGPIADSDEGINAAVWGFNSRALRELGPVSSRFGGVRTDGTKYATHPPLIVAETAVIELVAGEHPATTRAAAWLGSLAAIVLVFFIVRAIGLGPPAAAATTIAALAGHMLFVYGSMLDTMVIAFPFALAVSLVWYREWTGTAGPRPWLVLLLATVASLGGWQACFLVGLCGLSTLARARTDRANIRRALPYLLGVVIAVALTLGWAYWVYGSFSVLDDKLIRRTGGAGVTIPDMVTFQIPWLSQLLGLGFLAWIACAVSLRDRRFRPLAALSLASVILYALFLKEGSDGHQYWNYWGLFPAAIGVAYVFDALATALRTTAPKQPYLQIGALVGVALLIATVNLTREDEAATLIEQGYRPYELVDRTALPAGQTDLPYLAEPYRIDDWLRYRGGPAGQPLLDATALRALARDHPDHLVLLLGSCGDPDLTAICRTLTFADPAATDVAPRLVTAAELARRLDAPAPGPR